MVNTSTPNCNVHDKPGYLDLRLGSHMHRGRLDADEDSPPDLILSPAAPSYWRGRNHINPYLVVRRQDGGLRRITEVVPPFWTVWRRS